MNPGYQGRKKRPVGGKVPRRSGPWENWEKVQVLWISRGVGVFPSRVIRDEYRN